MNTYTQTLEHMFVCLYVYKKIKSKRKQNKKMSNVCQIQYIEPQQCSAATKNKPTATATTTKTHLMRMCNIMRQHAGTQTHTRAYSAHDFIAGFTCDCKRVCLCVYVCLHLILNNKKMHLWPLRKRINPVFWRFWQSFFVVLGGFIWNY